MPIGAEKAALMGAAGTGGGNYFGDKSLGNCQFGASSITQTGDTTAIDTVLTTGSEAGGPGNSSYGYEDNRTSVVNGVPYDTAVYELTVSNGTAAITSISGSTVGGSINSDGDMVLAQFNDLTIDASVCLTTNAPCRGLFVYVNGDCTINGALSMKSRGPAANPTSSGGSDSNAVDANGLRLGMLTASGSTSFTNDGEDFNGCGTAIRTAIGDNQPDLDGDGDVFTMSLAGGAGGAAGHANSAAPGAGSNGTTGGVTLSCGGGSGGAAYAETGMGAGTAGFVFGGGTGGGSGYGGATSGMGGTTYGGQGGRGYSNESGGSRSASGGGNPGGTYDYDGSGGNPNNRSGDGIGGIIWLVVKGDLTIGAAGSINATGNNSYNGVQAGGGSTGGGCIHALYGGTLSNSGSITAAGGTTVATHGAAGGAGGVNTTQVSD